MSDRENLVGGAAPFGRSDGGAAAGAGMPAGDIEAAQPEPTLLQQSSHPTALIFHLLFRVAAVFMYIFSGLFTSNSILTFVIIILLLAFDFWTVKNVTGRLLVGLRWWNEIREDGTNQWIFESRENGVPNAVDSRIFWTALYVAPAVWALLAVLALLRMQWGSLIVTLVAVAMCSANLFGYMQCEKDAKKRAASYIANQGIFTNIVGSMISTRIGAMFGSR